MRGTRKGCLSSFFKGIILIVPLKKEETPFNIFKYAQCRTTKINNYQRTELLMGSTRGKGKQMLKITANEILGTNAMRIYAEQGNKNLSVNINNYTYNQLARTILACANIECLKNLLISNGGEIHCEPQLNPYTL